MITNPTPWRMDGETIRDADGHVVISALNPCGMATRRRIVRAVNDLSLADEVRPNREAQCDRDAKATESSAGMGGVEYWQTMQIGAERSGGGRAEAKRETSRAAVAPNRAESLNRRNA